MNNFKGTWQLVKLAIRRDRLKLPLIILITAGIMAMVASSLSEIYQSAEERMTYAATTSSSFIAKIFGGVVDGPSIGSIIMVESYLFVGLIIAFMSTMIVVRHTRYNEENGSAELIGSTVVGRYASLVAALLLAVIANLITAMLMFLALLSIADVTSSGAFLMSASLGLVGIAFASIAALTSQLAESSRGANSLAAAIIGLAYIIRGMGDAFGDVSADGLSASSMWLSWLSPFGWGFQVHPFTQQNWGVLGLLIIFILTAISLSFYLLNKRDVGLAIFPARKGPAKASKNLLSAMGLTWRLQRGILYGWSISFIILGGIYGAMTKEFQDILATNEDAQQYLASLGGSGNFTDVFFAAMFGYTAVIAAGYCAQALMRMRSEESSQRIEGVLSTKVGRLNWSLNHILITVFGACLLMLILGLSTGLSYVIVAGADLSEIARLGLASLAQIPGIAAFVGFIVFVFAALPKATTAISWGVFALLLLMYQLGNLLELPQFIMNISPFTHVPSIPSQELSIGPLLALMGTGLLLGAIGLGVFKNRDLTLS